MPGVDEAYYDQVDTFRIGNPPIGAYIPITYPFKPIPLGWKVSVESFYAEVTDQANFKFQVFVYAGSVLIGQTFGLQTTLSINPPSPRVLYGGSQLRVYFPAIQSPGPSINVNMNYSGVRNPDRR